MFSTHQYKKFMHYLLACVLLSIVGTSCGESGPNTSSQDKTLFDLLHSLSEEIYDGNGTWGEKRYGYRMALRDAYWRADVYGVITERNPGRYPQFAQRAAAVYNYLVAVQSRAGTGVYPFPADVLNPEFGALINRIKTDCPLCIQDAWVISLPGDSITELYYDHGYALNTLSRAFLRTGDNTLLASIRGAADWALDKPLTSNVNYLSAMSKGLSLAYAATGDSKYLDRAIYLHETGILPNLSVSDGGALDSHNRQLEYHGFIVSGIIALKQVLPANHPFHATLDPYLALTTKHMRQRDMTEAANFGQTWPGTNLLAWYELSQLRPLDPGEIEAKNRCSHVIHSYREDIEKATGFVRQKALYSYFFIGLVE